MQNGGGPTKGGNVTCTFSRQWLTTYSDIQIEDWMNLTANFGFKVYPNITSTQPSLQGYIANFTLSMTDLASQLVVKLAILSAVSVSIA
jgi:hypothetical protein